MKELRALRLINWHRFENETIELGRETLLSGENGAGKSTILDAIQFCVTTSKTHFNQAAHEKGKRNLNSYIRCKTGREERPYERTGPLSAHICLEFYEETTGKYFLLGVVMDSASEDTEPKSAWYLFEDRQLSDDLFFAGRTVKGISKFRSTNKGLRKFVLTQQEARKMIQGRFGRLEDRFFSLIPKALAFRPIHDIKDFVYSYVLDEKKVNIDSLRENVRAYQDLERMLVDVRTRIGELKKIKDQAGEVEAGIRRDRMNEYFVARAELDLVQQAVSRTERDLEARRLERKDLEHQKEDNAAARESKEETVRSLQVELQTDENYRAYEQAKSREEKLSAELVKDGVAVRDLLGEARKAAQSAQLLLRLEEKNGQQQAKDIDVSLTLPALSGESEEITALSDYNAVLQDLRGTEDLSAAQLVLSRVQKYKGTRYKQVQETLARENVRISEKEEALREVGARIHQLEGRQLVYQPGVIALKRQIEEEFARTGRSGEVRILCEMLEITDKRWQNAVEGYLNTQRFYLITDPEQFDLAISVYDRMREKKKVYGVGLINTGKLEDYDRAPAGSLAEVVTSKNIWARRYVNMVLGRVHRCETYQELKSYPTAITPQCMRYSNHVVSAINPKIFRTPYIGAGAYKVQLEQAKKEQRALQGELSAMKKLREAVQAFEAPLSTEHDVRVRYSLDALGQERSHRAALEAVQKELEQLQLTRSFQEKQERLQQLQKDLRALSEKSSQIERQIGRVEEQIEQDQRTIDEKAREEEEKQSVLLDLTEKLGDEAAGIENEYVKLSKGRDPEEFRSARMTARKANWSRKEKAEEQMRELMRAYRARHDFGAADTYAAFPEYAAELDKLENSQLLEYEDKVTRARSSAEEEFREQFLSRLQENIKQAQGEFRSLNKALSQIHFSHEQYRFEYAPRRSLKKYYDMLMDDFDAQSGKSILTGSFSENHKEAIEELFEKLALDDESSAQALEEYTDYRTYMDYDIRISLDDGSYMLYSKVSREKSGGETQTPFYIVILSSFIQLYGASMGGDSVGLVMMDEAFNNMDDSRVRSLLQFLGETNLQVIIATPPEKIQFIGPSMDKVLLVMGDETDTLSYVEDFTHEIPAADEESEEDAEEGEEPGEDAEDEKESAEDADEG